MFTRTYTVKEEEEEEWGGGDYVCQDFRPDTAAGVRSW